MMFAFTGVRQLRPQRQMVDPPQAAKRWGHLSLTHQERPRLRSLSANAGRSRRMIMRKTW
jgi:hypothetical protein